MRDHGIVAVIQWFLLTALIIYMVNLLLLVVTS